MLPIRAARFQSDYRVSYFHFTKEFCQLNEKWQLSIQLNISPRKVFSGTASRKLYIYSKMDLFNLDLCGI